MNKALWRLKKVVGSPLTVGLVLALVNFLAITFMQPRTYIMGIATLAIFGGVTFIIEQAWMSLFVETEVETAEKSRTLRRILDHVILGTIILLMAFGGHHEFLAGPTARFRVVTIMMTTAVWIGYLTIWLHIRDKRSWTTIVADTATH